MSKGKNARASGASGAKLTHVDTKGRIRMVDVGAKPVTDREAVARGAIAMSATARKLIRAGAVKKGDPLQAARLAGIMAAKKTSDLIPLCHPLVLSHVSVELRPTRTGYRSAPPSAHPAAGRQGPLARRVAAPACCPAP